MDFSPIKTGGVVTMGIKNAVHQPRICERCRGKFTPTGNCQKYCANCAVERERARGLLRTVARSSDPIYKAKESEHKKIYYKDSCADLKYKDKLLVRGREWRNAHLEAERLRTREWNHAHLECGRLVSAKRRALKYDNTPIGELLTEAQWRDILDQYHHRCAYCGRKMDKLTIDHVTALSKGGKHSAANVVPLLSAMQQRKGSKNH